jgi:SAM-dependent methyltransferase
MTEATDLPEATLLVQQAAWLRPARAKLLRRVAIARRQRILELGAGRGAVTMELVRRGGGMTVALDRRVQALHEVLEHAPGATCAGADAHRLPFADASFDLIFTQLTLLWVNSLDRVLDEIARVLAPDGALVALEPDYGGMIEYPPEIAARPIWLAALRRAGADPLVGRKLPDALAARGLRVRVQLFEHLLPPDPARFDLLHGLPLTREERARLIRIEATSNTRQASRDHAWVEVAHLPFFLVTATIPP